MDIGSHFPMKRMRTNAGMLWLPAAWWSSTTVLAHFECLRAGKGMRGHGALSQTVTSFGVPEVPDAALQTAEGRQAELTDKIQAHKAGLAWGTEDGQGAAAGPQRQLGLVQAPQRGVAPMPPSSPTACSTSRCSPQALSAPAAAAAGPGAVSTCALAPIRALSLPLLAPAPPAHQLQ